MAPVYLVMVQLSHKEIRGLTVQLLETTHSGRIVSSCFAVSLTHCAQESHIVLRGKLVARLPPVRLVALTG